jgi:putative NADH-flavin reductase
MFCPTSIRPEPPTGAFKIATEVLPSNFLSEIGTGDLALAILKELHRDEFVRVRVGISK